MLQIRLLGQFVVVLEGKRVVIPSRPGQSLFAYLALTRGTMHRREKLAGLFWSDTPDDIARRNLRQQLWVIRKALATPKSSDGDYFRVDEISIGFDPQSDFWLDVAQLERPLDNAELSDLTQRATLYQGELLPGFYDDWVLLPRERVQAVFESLMQVLVARLVEAQQWNGVMEWSERWLSFGSAPEPAFRGLLRAYAARGDMAKVQSVYQRCVIMLQGELGVEPSMETQALYEGIVKGAQMPQRVALQELSVRASDQFTGTELPVPGDTPFKGLQFFDVEDAGLFFGREALTTTLDARIEADSNSKAKTLTYDGPPNLLVVVGASGSGKSSLVRAGLIPAILAEKDDWRVEIITPTARPLQALATVLTRDSESVTATATLMDDLAQDPRAVQLFLARRTPESQRQIAERKSPAAIRHLLLVVDQFEELFTLCRDEFARQAFIDNLVYALTNTPPSVFSLILTLRADFYAHLAQYPELRDAVAKEQEYIGPMTSEELRRAIEEPAKQGGWEFEPGLVDLILRDVANPMGSQEPGALPLLSHALLETWKRRAGHTLTLKGYHEAGGVRGAIAQTADSTYQQLSPEEQQIARNIFVRLTELGEGTEDTRRRATIQELIPRPEDADKVRDVLNQLAAARLLTLGQDTSEVAHEALIREWGTLREWLTQGREGLRLHRHLTEATQDWETLERDAGALYRGTRLAQAREWAALNDDALNPQERAFLQASAELEQREFFEREAQQQRELDAAKRIAEQAQTLAQEQKARAEEQSRTNKRLRQRAVWLVGALILALGLAAVAFLLGDQATRNASQAQANAAQAEANATAADAARLQVEKENRAASARELAASAIANLDIDPERSILLALQAVETTRNPDGIVLREAEEALHRAVESSHILRTIPNLQNPNAVAFSPDGTRVAVRSDNTIGIWDVDSGRAVVTLAAEPRSIDNIYFSPNGKQLMVVDIWGGANHDVKLFDTDSGALLRTITLPKPSDKWVSAAVSQDWSQIALGTWDGYITVWDLKNDRLVSTLFRHFDIIEEMAFSPDGTRIGTSSDDGTAKIWDVATAKELLTLNGDGKAILAIAFSPDGKRVATGGLGQIGRIWDAETGKELVSVALPSWLNQIAFDSDGTQFVTADGVGNVKIWDTATGKELMSRAGHQTGASNVVFSKDGTKLATTGGDGTARIWDLALEHEFLTLPTGGVSDTYIGEAEPAYSPDGEDIAVGLTNGTIPIWDAASGKLLMTLRGHTGAVHKIAYSPDGTKLASASSDKTAIIWDTRTGSRLLTLTGHDGWVTSVAWSPDGKELAAGGVDNSIRIWDALTGKFLTSFATPLGEFHAIAYSPDGKYLAAHNASEETLIRFDLTTGKVVYQVKNGFAIHLAYSKDGSRIALAVSGPPLIVDAATGKTVMTLEGPIAGQNWIAYSPDGSRIATANADGSATLFEAASGKALLTLKVGDLALRGLSFSPDGTQLATADDQAVRVFLLRIEDLIALAKTRVTRSLTQEECVKYLHQPRCPQQ